MHLILKSLFILFFLTVHSVASQPTASEQSSNLRFTILHTNDEHSHLIPHPAVNDHPELTGSAMGGFARLAGAIQQIREEKERHNEPVLLFSAGDILGGPAFGWLPLLDGMAPELTLFQKMGYDAVTIGNHEFDYGSEVFANYLKAAGYPEASSQTVILGTNVNPPSDHPISQLGIRNHFIKELENGLKIGIFGLIGLDAISKTAHPEPVTFDDPVESARAAVEELTRQGADLLIAVTHSGVHEDRFLAQSVPEIDVIVGGHSHTPLYQPITEGKTVIVQAGNHLNYLGILELEWLHEEERVRVLNEESERPFLKPLDATVPESERVRERVDFYRSALNEWLAELTDSLITEMSQPVARSEFTLRGGRHQSESAIGNYITDAMRTSAEAHLGKRVDIAVQANGAIRANIAPGSEEWSEGVISFYDLVMAAGLGSGADGNPGYPLVSIYLTEQEVRRALELSLLLSDFLDNTFFLQFSGLRTAFDPNRAVVMRIPFAGTPIPSSRAVLQAERMVGEDSWQSVSRRSDELLHVVTDHYIAGFLPMVGDIFPQFRIEFKNEAGDPINLDEAIILTENDTQLKLWQALLEFTISHPPDEEGLPAIPSIYESPEGRQVVVTTLPLWIWPLAALLLIVLVVVTLKRR